MVKCPKCGTKAATWCLLVASCKSDEEHSDSDDYDAPEDSIARMFQCTRCFAMCSQRLPMARGKNAASVVAYEERKYYINGLYGDRLSEDVLNTIPDAIDPAFHFQAKKKKKPVTKSTAPVPLKLKKKKK
jgi:hypothetical protein